MKPKILVISISDDLTEKAKNISRELKIPLTIYQGGIMKDGHKYAKKMEENFDVIISQGGTAQAIRETVNIPVVSIVISIADFLDALLKAKEYGNKIALMSYKTEELDDLEKFKEVLDIDFKIFPYANSSELKNQIKNIKKEEKITLVNMGSCICNLAAQNQINSVLIKSSKKSIKQAIISANNIIELGRREKERAERLKAIVDHSVEGIIAIDENGIITTLNPVAKKILDISSDDIIGTSISNFKSKFGFNIYEDNSIQMGKVININDIPVIINKILINVDNNQVGSIITIAEISKLQKLEQKVRNNLYNKGLIAKYSFSNIIGSSIAIKKTVEQAMQFGKTSTTVLIQGETGSGKELFAQSIHNISPRRKGPFVAINCAALPENLLESELFGYEEGAFTGAKKGGKLGLFELAHKGTIFLDEIGEIPLSLQSRLLRVLQEKEVMRIGGDCVLNVDVRIIAATNLDLYRMVAEKKFREDLYFRINVLNLKIPPLRERREDIPFLVKNFIELMNNKHETSIDNITQEGMNSLKKYDWPGNIRELENFIEKMVILSNISVVNKDFIEQLLEEHIPNRNSGLLTSDNIEDILIIKKGSLKDMEIQIINAMNKEIKDNKALLAEKLGISRSTLWKKLKEK
ncbi:sigma 54-interacting transcriptional regulator [Clostridiaceae bacterium UIB06]|uniref:Sigma 54-interacting transcriptional regulator n=1 Tax=Clostridium thailandense TaxID=2794346 RepID=A0A949TPS2_9CLOT|nr:sigma 54-interacting transcriptional regulator [Clostridium thailandense]MBV7274322.1 sigma 54-interacting transcriptional regulator [Clostridium thailandense]MCH5136222.1 sigma 54-interacting transcriptional regulator [Clostridiaceae bacterium UIB06]